ncbi:aminopeptidase [Acidiphilium sp. AL]|uniref:Aminopeptidase n=1 Tax=Acidiphilium iwatense TaxID=768198 RepID=A0ABS9E1D8_9PROT|nr:MULTISPECIES: aminopeptidase [Acidiphilium]MCF3948829.1 aminopeptidase [Acidiphilium iwatense]MCU4161358.1 aminopeptidase [Acidiphilium sp. AL]
MTRDKKLGRLAEIAVKIGVNVQKGQELIVNAPIEAQELVRRIAEHAYRAGATLVVPFFADDATQRARYLHAGDESFDFAPAWMGEAMAKAIGNGAAMLTVVGSDPMLLADCDPARIGRAQRAAAAAMKPVRNLLSGFATNWSILSFATPAWARAIFPDIAEGEAVAKLWDAIFAVTRVDLPDPIEAWRDHAASLLDRCGILNNKRFAALHFRGPGTDLRVGLAENHLWAGGAIEACNGVVCLPNMPTEEVFSMPHKNNVEGIVSATKPLVYGGVLIEGISVRFEAGRIVEVHASKGEDVFKSLIDTDEGASRLGEVALVPDASPVSRAGLIFRNTLFDENAASHIALGQALALNMKGGCDAAQGANESMIHVDWMIGSAQIDVDGIAASGTAEPVMRAGAFVIRN